MLKKKETVDKSHVYFSYKDKVTRNHISNLKILFNCSRSQLFIMIISKL